LKEYEKEILKNLKYQRERIKHFWFNKKIYNELSVCTENIDDFIDKIIGKNGIIYYENNTFIFDSSRGHKVYKMYYPGLKIPNLKFEIKKDFDIFEFQKFIDFQKGSKN